MSRLLRLAKIADGMGLRPLVARAASMVYPQDFRVDREGRWLNCQPGTTFASPSIHTASYHEVEKAVLGNWTWQYSPREGDTVIDVGAGIGEETVIFSRLVGPAGRVVSIEAHPQTFAALEQTIALSGLSNVTALCCAVADTNGEMFISSAAMHESNSVVGQREGIKIPARTLDSIADELALASVDFLKMNIEGAERLALKGMPHLAPRIANAVISCHDFIADFFGGGEQFRTKEEVTATLRGLGFTLTSRPDAVESWIRDYLFARRSG